MPKKCTPEEIIEDELKFVAPKEVELECAYCNSKCTVHYDEKDTRLDPIYCPFCSETEDPIDEVELEELYYDEEEDA